MLNNTKTVKTKSHTAYKTISEVANILNITTSTIRFWEKEFKQIKPYIINKRRYYSQININLIAEIKDLLYEKNYTLLGAKKYFKNKKSCTENTEVIQLKSKIKKIIDLVSSAKKELEKKF
ncbi:MAG: MerR family transcriptional regulator [Rickettsiales bacterium]|nr:MerR family transcriptional regulator [Rickettsiales bacterium]